LGHLTLCAQIYLIEGSGPPYETGKSLSFKLAFWEQDKGTFTGPYKDPEAIPSVRLWMVMSGGRSHGSNEISVTRFIDESGKEMPGVFILSDVAFSMTPDQDGDYWEIYIKIKNGDSFVEDHQIIWSSLDN
jgi:hypothetical protein